MYFQSSLFYPESATTASMAPKMIFFLLLIHLYGVFCGPTSESWIVSSVSPASEEITKDGERSTPRIYSLRVDSNVTNRFASSLVTSKVKNLGTHAEEATFSVILPETAYISGFVMEIDGKKYEAYIEEKDKAKKTYDQAVSSGNAAGHVAVSARDSNKFTVSVNIMPESKAIFYLRYEELLSRQKGLYDIVVNLHPGQPVKDIVVQVNINETRPLTSVSTPSLRSGNEISKNEVVDPKAAIEYIGKNAAKVTFKPDIATQEQFTKELGTDVENGFAGQFIVQYDVERDPDGGELLFADGYFVHFFAPKDAEPEPKQISFVLDTSGSMYGRKIRQMKEAMKSILDQLKPEDSFNIIDFNSLVNVWNIPNNTVHFQEGEDYPFLNHHKFSRKDQTMPHSYEVSGTNIEKAKQLVESLNPSGGTNIESALNIVLRLHKLNKESDQRQPLIMFLTDGEPTEGVISSDGILAKVSDQNSDGIPIIALSFGSGADKKLLQKLSLRNHGFSRHIYDGSDADIQLKSFYEIISSPLFNKIKFTYATENVTELTKTEFPILFNGSELVVAGKYVQPQLDPGFAPGRLNLFRVPLIECYSGVTPKQFKPKVAEPMGSLEKHWAYLTLKQILKDREISDKKEELTKKALDLALKYSFVTPVSSLVVVKPNETRSETGVQDASKDAQNHLPGRGFYRSPAYRPTGPSLSAPLNVFAASIPSPPYRISSNRISAFGASGTPVSWQTNSMKMMDSFDTAFEQAVAPSTTPAPFVFTTEKPKSFTIEKLKREIPWFGNLYVADNDTLRLPQGNFLLGTKNQVAEMYPECQKPPMNATGNCVLLEMCPKIYPSLGEINSYIFTYFCPLGRYAGVCCPKNLQEINV